MRTKFVLFCWGRKTSATEYELQNAPLNTFSSSKTLQVKWNKNTRTDALNPLNLYLTLNLNDSRTEINHCSHKHKQVSDSFIKDQLETKEKPTKKTWILGRKRFLKSGRRLRASNQTMLTLNAARNKTTPAATCRQTTRSIGSTIYRRLQAAAVRLNHSYTRDTKNTLIYKLNHLHRLPKETKHSLLNKQSVFIWFTEKHQTWNGRAESKYKNVFKFMLLSPQHAKNTSGEKWRWGSSSSSSVTLCSDPIAHLLLKPPAPLLSLPEAPEPQTPLPVWLQQWRLQRRRQQQRLHRKCPPPPPLLLLSWWRCSAGGQWAPCWATAWRRCTTTSEETNNRSDIWRFINHLYWSDFIFSYLHSDNLQNRRDGRSVERNKHQSMISECRSIRPGSLLTVQLWTQHERNRINKWSKCRFTTMSSDQRMSDSLVTAVLCHTLSSTLRASFRNQSSSSSTQYVSNGSWQISHDCTRKEVHFNKRWKQS